MSDKNSCPFQVNFLSQIGSKLYGTSTENSDDDLRGFCVPTTPYLMGIHKFDQWESQVSDTVVYSYRKFLEMLVRGNTKAIEAIFSNNIVVSDDLGKYIISNRASFISRKHYNAIKGYAFAEFRKAQGLQFTLKSETKWESLDLALGKFNLKSYDREAIFNYISEIIHEEAYNLIPNNQVSDNHLSDIREIGYRPKNMSHAIRILTEGINLLKHRMIVFPLHNSNILLEIKLGQIPQREVINLYNNTLSKFEQVYQEVLDSLPKTIDITNFYIEGLEIAKVRF